MLALQKRNLIRRMIFLAFLVVLGIFVWSVLIFFKQLKREELAKMEIWVQAQTELLKSNEVEDINPVLLSVLQKNTTTPMILYSVKDSLYEGKNLKDRDLSQKKLAHLTRLFAIQNDPIEVSFENEAYEVVYYGDSSFIQKAKYAPLVIVLVVFFFLFILYYFYSISKSNEQNRLWAGMAKETAHQIGTPLSSLVGWTEILKSEGVEEDYIVEIEKDIDRLEKITNRFSKIGSVPTLEKADFVEVATAAFEYMRRRGSRLIEFSIEAPGKPLFCMLNEDLLGWTIENLVKNAIDAMKGKGNIHLEITENHQYAILKISDTGKGIPKKRFKTIFKPGETSKKRGWGLGLTLAKRIIQDYHRGKIKVLHSEINKGTTFGVLIKKVEP